jgi:crossover junction endodeoxyribonuclease RuvC
VRVIGIDPGVAVTGFAVIEGTSGRLRPVAMGVVRTAREDAPGRRLATLQERLGGVLRTHSPRVAAVERVFFSANVKTAMAVGQASGIVLAEAARQGVVVSDYTPLEVKQAVVGFGGAPKLQVQAMVARLLGLSAPARPSDVADACALAICHLNRAGLAAALRGATA